MLNYEFQFIDSPLKKKTCNSFCFVNVKAFTPIFLNTTRGNQQHQPGNTWEKGIRSEHHLGRRAGCLECCCALPLSLPYILPSSDKMILRRPHGG